MPSKSIYGFALCFFSFLYSVSAQKIENPFTRFKDASWLKNADIAVAKNTETYTFKIENTEGEGTHVALTKNVDEWLFPSKTGQTFLKRLHVNDEIVVEDVKIKIKGSNKLNKYKVDVHDVQDEDIFSSDAQVCDYAMPFDQMLEMNHLYTAKVKDVRYQSIVFFPDMYPIAEKEVVFDVPDWLAVDFKEYNFEGNKIIKSVAANPKGGKRVVFTIKELAAYKVESKAPNAKKVFPHLLLLFKSFKNEGKTNQIFENVGDLYTFYSKICKDIGNKSDVLKTHVGKLVAGKKTDLEKIEAIFYWVQDNIRYIAFENGIMGFRPDACQTVYKNLYGDCKGMANLLKQMLTLANFDARLTWIGTNDIPYDYSTPCLAVDNHMICTVILNDKKYFLDGTEDYIPIDDYATRIQGRQVLIEDGKNYMLDHIPTFNNNRNIVVQKINLSLNNQIMTGTVDATYAGETKTRILYIYNHIPNDKKNDALKEFIGSGNQNMSVKSVETSAIDDRKNAFKVKSNFELNHVVSSSGNEMYLTLDLDKEYGDFQIDSSRLYDWEFHYPSSDEITTTFTIPVGYKVDYLPDAVKVSTSFFNAELKYQQQGEQIIYTKKFSVPNMVLKKENFLAWNKSIKSIRTFYKDQIVLVKK